MSTKINCLNVEITSCLKKQEHGSKMKDNLEKGYRYLEAGLDGQLCVDHFLLDQQPGDLFLPLGNHSFLPHRERA